MDNILKEFYLSKDEKQRLQLIDTMLDEYEFSFPCGFTLHLPDHSLDRASFRMFIDHLCFLLGKCLFVL